MNSLLYFCGFGHCVTDQSNYRILLVLAGGKENMKSVNGHTLTVYSVPLICNIKLFIQCVLVYYYYYNVFVNLSTVQQWIS